MKKTKVYIPMLLSMILVIGIICSTVNISAAEVNLALNKDVLYHDAIDNEAWAAENLTDGKTKSEEGLNGYSTNSAHDSQDNEASFIIDLGGEVAFNRVVLYPRTDVTIPDTQLAVNFPVDFVIETADNEEFENATEVIKVTDKTTTIDKAVTLDFNKATARYIRLRATKLGQNEAGGGFRLQLAEFEVYNIAGKDIPNPTNKPETTTDAPNKPEVPKTGDGTVISAIVLVICSAGAVVFFKKKDAFVK